LKDILVTVIVGLHTLALLVHTHTNSLTRTSFRVSRFAFMACSLGVSFLANKAFIIGFDGMEIGRASIESVQLKCA
jgi:hypothetical protein